MHAFFIHFHWKQTSFLQFLNEIQSAELEAIR